jgi:hypothetical protein
MKQLFSLIMILIIGVLAGCGGGNNNSTTDYNSGDKSESGIVKLGLGHNTSIASSKDLGVDAEGKEVTPVGQVDTVMVAAAFDKDGKVVKVMIDNAQTKVNFDKALQVTSDTAAEYKTKVELGDDYGMIKASKIGKEWYQEIAELEKWMVGKTVEEVKAMKVVQKDESHPSVPDVAELTSLVTLSVQDYIAALDEAYTTAVTLEKGTEKVGLGQVVSIGKSKGLGKDAEGKEVTPLAQVDTVMLASAFDKDGKVISAVIDSAQTKVKFDNQGKVASDKAVAYKTKVELGDEYGLIKASKIGKEWYQQIAELQKWMVGKTADEVKAMKVVEKDGSSVSDEAELTSSVTISVQDYIASLSEAYQKAK